jgi:O-acetyl-ADP-ribose deacetylase (regulator of RNase III)
MKIRYIDMEVVRGPNYSPNIKMISGDVFESVEALGHCISADVQMGAGIAYDFKCEFGGVQELFMQRILPGGVAVLERKVEKEGLEQVRYIYNLVTKTRYSDKPTLETLRASLEAMKRHALKWDVPEICLPKIGTGLDMLWWNEVYQAIHETFVGTNILIKIFVLPRECNEERANMIKLMELYHEDEIEVPFRDWCFLYGEMRSQGNAVLNMVQC